MWGEGKPNPNWVPLCLGRGNVLHLIWRPWILIGMRHFKTIRGNLKRTISCLWWVEAWHGPLSNVNPIVETLVFKLSLSWASLVVTSLLYTCNDYIIIYLHYRFPHNLNLILYKFCFCFFFFISIYYINFVSAYMLMFVEGISAFLFICLFVHNNFLVLYIIYLLCNC